MDDNEEVNSDMMADKGIAGVLGSAAILARQGRYDEASVLLQSINDAPPKLMAAVLDLQARIYAQQGRYAEAEALWLKALSIDPGNRSYRAALDALVDRRLSMPWYAKLVILLIALAAIVVIAFFWSGRTASKGSQPDTSLASQASAQPHLAIVDANIITQEITSLSAQIAAMEQENRENRRLIESLSRQNRLLQARISEYQQLTATSLNNLSSHVDSLGSEIAASSDATNQCIDKMATPPKKCLLEGVAEVLWFPFDLVLNLGRDRDAGAKK